MPHHLIHHALLGPLGHQVLPRLTACLALAVFSGLLRGDPHIGASPLVSAIRAWVGRRRGRAEGTSLTRQPRQATEQRDRRKSVEQPRADRNSLSALELAVVAELNLEMARAQDELANDAGQAADARRLAQVRAMALRERADSLHLEARRLTAQPMLYVPALEDPGPRSTAPERRRHDRRTGACRRTTNSAAGPPGGRERRTTPDRRKSERRDAPLVAG